MNRFLSSLEVNTERKLRELIWHIKYEKAVNHPDYIFPKEFREAIINLSNQIERNEEAISMLTDLDNQRPRLKIM